MKNKNRFILKTDGNIVKFIRKNIGGNKHGEANTPYKSTTL